MTNCIRGGRAFAIAFSATDYTSWVDTSNIRF